MQKNNKNIDIANSCPACLSDKVKYSFEIEDYYCALDGVFKMHKCLNCSSYFIYPQMDSTEISAYYKGDYCAYNVGAPQAKSFLRFFNFFYIWNAVWDIINKGGTKYGRMVLKNTKGNFLDVGSGNCFFLGILKNLNPEMNLYGTDPFSTVSEQEMKEKGINFYKQDLYDVKFPANNFQFISLTHVLEHLDDPNRMMAELERILSDDGIINIVIPNVTSVFRFLFGKYWCGFHAPRHYVNFSVKAIFLLAKKHGLRVHKIKHVGNTTHLVESILFSIYKKNKDIGIFKSKFFMSSVVAVLNPIVKLVNLIRLGDSMEIYLKKNDKIA